MRLTDGDAWSDVLKKIAPGRNACDVEGVPYAMQPEALCGTEVEEIQRKTAVSISTIKPHEVLSALLELDFDAIITTNYSYEIETVLSGGEWNRNKRRRSFTTLYGSSHVRHNTCVQFCAKSC